MKIAFLLHFYQPYTQQEDILKRIVNECYLPLTRGLLERPHARVIVNINAALSELLVNTGNEEVVKNIATLAQRGQIELTGSAKYHAFLPLLPNSEVKRQVVINTETNSRFYGDLYNPVGFFPPEMAVSSTIFKNASELGFKWVAAPQVSFAAGTPSTHVIYKEKESGLNVFFRNKRVSSLALSGVCRDAKDFIKETQDIHRDGYWFCVMDAETFGHHRIGHEKFLFDVLDNPFFTPVTASDLLSDTMTIEETEIRPSTWTNEEQDFWLDQEHKVSTDAKSFILWKDPDNPIHKLQWELVQVVSDAVNKAGEIDANDRFYTESREKLDKALASDQFWWASAKPWWSLEMVEQGAYALKEVLSTLTNAAPTIVTETTESMLKSEDLYRAILDQAFEWQRTGYIRKRHLDNSSTYMKQPFKKRTPAEWYNQILLEFEDEMKKATERKDFEKAVKWRDAIIKIHNETDIYDVLHVVDELWSARNIPSVKPFLDHKPEELSDYIKQYIQPL